MGVRDVAESSIGTRKQRLRERLRQLPPGTMLGFTSLGGMSRARVRSRRDSRDRMLLCSDDGGREVWVETDDLARLMAEGNAWIVRRQGSGA